MPPPTGGGASRGTSISHVRYRLRSEEGERLTARRRRLYLSRSVPRMEVLILRPCSFVRSVRPKNSETRCTLTLHGVVQRRKQLDTRRAQNANRPQRLTDRRTRLEAAKDQRDGFTAEQSLKPHERLGGGHVNPRYERQIEHEEPDGVVFPGRRVDERTDRFFDVGDGPKEEEACRRVCVSNKDKRGETHLAA